MSSPFNKTGFPLKENGLIKTSKELEREKEDVPSTGRRRIRKVHRAKVMMVMVVTNQCYAGVCLLARKRALHSVSVTET